jgi:hypothetical protein
MPMTAISLQAAILHHPTVSEFPKTTEKMTTQWAKTILDKLTVTRLIKKKENLMKPEGSLLYHHHHHHHHHHQPLVPF